MEEQSEPLKIVIIGGVAGGASAAARARRVNASAKITMIEKGPAISFANCGLPYHIGGEIATRDDLLVASPKLFKEQFDVDVRTHTEATAIDRESKTVTLRLADGDVEAIPYDKLILSPGAEPFHPPFIDKQYSNVSTLWSLTDMDRIMDAIADRPSVSAVVIGGGFVGLEVAEQLVERGHRCTVIERNGQVLKTLDREMAQPIEDELSASGITLRLGATVTALESGDGSIVTGVRLGDEVIPADLVVVSIGVRPRTKLAVDAGLQIGPAGGIQVDKSMRTSDPDIFAVGDCVEYQHAVLGHPTRVPLAGPANRTGRIAGAAAAGMNGVCAGAVYGTNVVRVFNKTAASTGLNSEQCDAAGIAHRSVFIQATDHASYYPGAEPMILKLLYTPQGRILGAQGVGGRGVDKRIDVIATAIHFGGSVTDLTEVDLAYAPPYGSAKDPVHMLGFVACNDLESEPSVVPPDADLSGYQVVDVRTGKEIEQLPLDGAIHAPIDELRQQIAQLDSNRPTVTVCHTGKRAHVAACLLKGSGFNDVHNLTGGMSVRSLTQR